MRSTYVDSASNNDEHATKHFYKSSMHYQARLVSELVQKHQGLHSTLPKPNHEEAGRGSTHLRIPRRCSLTTPQFDKNLCMRIARKVSLSEACVVATSLVPWPFFRRGKGPGIEVSVVLVCFVCFVTAEEVGGHARRERQRVWMG